MNKSSVWNSRTIEGTSVHPKRSPFRHSWILEGIAPLSSSANAVDSPSIQRIAEALGPGERFGVRLRLAPGENHVPSIGMRLVAETAAHPGSSTPGALVTRVNTALVASAPHLRFALTGDQEDVEAEWIWRYELTPQPLQVMRMAGNHRDLQPRLPTGKSAEVLLAAPRLREPVTLHQALMTLTERGVAICVELEYLAFALDAGARRRLDAIRFQKIECATDIAGLPDPEVRNHAAAGLLDTWRRIASGWQLRCRVSAPRPVDEALLCMIGEAILGRSVAADGSNSRHSEDTLDLGASLPRGMALPSALPAAITLRDLGMPQAVPEARDLPEEGTVLGWLNDANRREICIPHFARDRHAFIIGATGAGKSTLLYNMAVQDMRRGAGVAVIDPHGDLVSSLLSAVPAERIKDVILIDFSDQEYAVGLNLLELGGNDRALQAGFAVNELLAIAWRLYGSIPEALGPAFELYCRAALHLLLESGEQDVTLADLPRVFQSGAFRRRLSAACDNPVITEFWREAEKTTHDQSLANFGPYVANKFNRFVMHPLLRHVVCQARSTVDFRSAMDKRKILLVNLAKGIIGDTDCRMAGMLVLGKLFAAATARSRIRMQDRHAMHLYVDEFQSIATSTMATMLAEGRKFGLNMTLATQSLGGLGASDGMIGAILANVATLVALRLGPQDAENLASFFRPKISIDQLTGSPDYCGFVRLPPQTPILPGLTLRTLPEMVRSCERKSRRLARRVRSLHARRRVDIEKEIRERFLGRAGEAQC